jgi:hypothetical protein
MEDDNEMLIAACASILIASVSAVTTIASVLSRRKRKRKHKVWVRSYIKHRDLFGTYSTLIPELFYNAKFHAYLRMDKSTFEQLLLLLEPEISRSKTRFR